MVTWRKNVFKLPSGSIGKKFTQSLTKLYVAWAEQAPLECIALKVAALAAPLLLQQPAGKTSYRENAQHLERRLVLWEKGSIAELVDECTTIQAQLINAQKTLDDSTLAKRFASMVFNNNLKGAMSIVCQKAKGGVLALDAATKKEMKAKHPPAEVVSPDVLMTGPLPPDKHPIFFAPLNGELIRKCTLRTRGSAGISQQEDTLWHKMVSSFNTTSSSLCNAVAALATRYASQYVDPKGLMPLLANRGIAIDKCPGLRPVGVGEILRRILGKAIMSVTADEVQKSVGALQLCAGHPNGVEAAIHSMRETLSLDKSEGILLIDADNAFNRVNRAVALNNVQYICPAFKFALINTYREPSRIFMTDGKATSNFYQKKVRHKDAHLPWRCTPSLLCL